MTRTAKRIAACTLFVFGVTAGLAPIRAANAAEAAGTLQCWHWFWQAQDKCSWCSGTCETDLCCTTPAEASLE